LTVIELQEAEGIRRFMSQRAAEVTQRCAIFDAAVATPAA
jgi:hypothetical protein